MSSSLLEAQTLFTNPLNVLLTFVLLYTLTTLLPSTLPLISSTKGVKKRHDPSSYNWIPLTFPQCQVWQTFTPLELRKWDGRDGKKILVAINKRIFDLTSSRNFYGPDGPYGNFAGRDASRGLAKQSFDLDMLTSVDDVIDPCLDLTEGERQNLKEWAIHFMGKYTICGELIENSDRSSNPL